MATIKECINKNVKISKNSITIKGENNKTAGVVRDAVSLYNLQANKQMDFCKQLKSAGAWGKIGIKDCIICDNKMYVFRNVKSKLFNEKHGYFSEEEKAKAEEKEKVYTALIDAGIPVIECIFV